MSQAISIIELIKKINGVILKTARERKLEINKEDIVPGASFKDDLGFESMDMNVLTMNLVIVFDTNISDEDAEKIRTVRDLHNYILSKG